MSVTTRVLIVAASVPAQQAALNEKLRELRDMGAEVAIAGYFDPELLPLDGLVATVYPMPPIRGTHTPRFKRALAAATLPQRIWLHVKHNPHVRRAAARADVLVALDQTATHAVWELAQRHRRPAAVFGMVPALRAVEKHRAAPDTAAVGVLPAAPAWGGVAYRSARAAAITVAATAVRSAVSPIVMKTGVGANLWSAAVAVPGLPDRVRRRLAYTVHVNMLKADLGTAAVKASGRAAQRLTDKNMRADLLVREAYAERAHGGTPASMATAIDHSLRLAEEHIKRKELRLAGPVLYRAMSLLLHRTLHGDRLTSPLADDPAGYLAAWRASSAVAKLEAPGGRAAGYAPRPADRPVRLLVAVDSGHDLAGEAESSRTGDLMARYENMPGVEVRFLDFAEHEDLSEMTLGAKQVIDARITGTSVYANRVETLLRPYLEWADTVLVEGALAPAAMFTLLDPGDTRMIVRWHGGETFGLWPHLTDWSRIDDVVFEADHVRDLAVEVVPRLAPMSLHTVASALTLRGLARPKAADARFTVGMVGVGGVAKDPRWAVEVLRRLRERDGRYRLLLLGEDLDPVLNYVDGYDEALAADLNAAGDAVHRHTVDDLPAQLAEVGVILNASVREGFPRTLVLGAASGAVPIARDWPFFAGRIHGAHTLLPTDWVVGTPEQAAQRIAKLTASEETWREAGRVASEYAIDTWDFTETRHAFDEILGV